MPWSSTPAAAPPELAAITKPITIQILSGATSIRRSAPSRDFIEPSIDCLMSTECRTAISRNFLTSSVDFATPRGHFVTPRHNFTAPSSDCGTPRGDCAERNARYIGPSFNRVPPRRVSTREKAIFRGSSSSTHCCIHRNALSDLDCSGIGEFIP